MIHDSVVSCIGATPMVRLGRLFPAPDAEVLAKLESLNPGGSIKDRPARYIIEKGIENGTITPNSTLVESTSGNLGVALAMVSKLYGLRFTAVVDPHIAPTNMRILELLGADVQMVIDPDALGGFLEARVKRVKEILSTDPRSIWINQYANSLNLAAHYSTTGEEIVSALDGAVDVLVVAVSSSGTIMGTARRLREEYPQLHVIGVDVVGSVIFGGPPARRSLPGIGSTRCPELLHLEEIDRVVHVTEDETIAGCRCLLDSEAILAGASSGAVIAAIRKLLPIMPKPARVVTILPDRGERYLDQIFGVPHGLASG